MENSVNSHITAESHMIASMTGTGQVKKTLRGWNYLEPTTTCMVNSV